MIPLTYDLHIHSCLSPCGSDDMTPANIVGMAALKGLNVIAVTDHNSCRNCYPVQKVCEEYGLTLLCGMELCTLEEVHVLCLFPGLEQAMDFDRYVYERLLPFPNNEKIFGKQLLYNDRDEIIGSEASLLINSTQISFDQLPLLLKDYSGIMIPAHMDKESNSLISNLGFIPPSSEFLCAEFKDMKKLHSFQENHSYLHKCRIISNSDAHYLEQIHEPDFTLLAESQRPEDILKALYQQYY